MGTKLCPTCYSPVNVPARPRRIRIQITPKGRAYLRAMKKEQEVA